MIYDLIAPVYDKINSEIDYSAWADFIEKIIKNEYKSKAELVLDLGCGTGKMTLELAARGYDMTALDYSSEMLNVARELAEEKGMDKNILFLMQDMTDFELYGTVDVTISCLDSINHLTKTSELDRCMSLVHNYLMPDGLFIFDVNGRRKFESVYAQNSYAMEEEGAFCIWQNDYNEKTRLCDFYITLFSERDDGAYERQDETQRERMYTLAYLKKVLIKNKFEFIGAYSDFDFNSASDESERIYIVARAKK